LAVPLWCAFARRRDQGAWRFLGVWLVSLWLPMVLAAGLIDPSSPRVRDYHIRYWFLIVPAMFLALAATVRQVALWTGPRWRAAVAALLVAVLALAALSDLRAVNNTMRFRALGATHPDEIRAWFQTAGRDIDVVWTDSRSIRVLPLYTTDYRGRSVWEGEFRAFDRRSGYRDVAELDGAVIVYDLGLRYLSRRGDPLPDEYLDLREHWLVDVARADGTLWIAREPDRAG
jgi:hypothetical protein